MPEVCHNESTICRDIDASIRKLRRSELIALFGKVGIQESFTTDFLAKFPESALTAFTPFKWLAVYIDQKCANWDYIRQTQATKCEHASLDDGHHIIDYRHTDDVLTLSKALLTVFGFQQQVHILVYTFVAREYLVNLTDLRTILCNWAWKHVGTEPSSNLVLHEMATVSELARA